MNTNILATLTEQGKTLMLPVQTLTALTVTNMERLVALQMANLQNYSDLSLSQWEAVTQINNLESLHACFLKQGQILIHLGEKLVQDVQEVSQMGQEILTKGCLEQQNKRFAGTGGVSQGNRCLGFVPAFYDQETGSTYLSRLSDGSPAPCHTLDGLPDEIVVARDLSGRVEAIKGSVIAGFVRQNEFYTREQAAQAVG